MNLSYERNIDLAYDTDTMRTVSRKFDDSANKLHDLTVALNKCLTELASTGWTTPAGLSFQQLGNEDWEKNMKQYVDLLFTFSEMLREAASSYDELTTDCIEKVHL